MKARKISPDDPNYKATSTADFVRYYNASIPKAFPRASVRALEEFQRTHKRFFDDKNVWTIDKHRKRVMEWLPSYYVA